MSEAGGGLFYPDDLEDEELTDEEAQFWGATALIVYGLILADMYAHPEGAARCLNQLSQ